MGEQHRLFLGIPIPPEISQTLYDFQENMPFQSGINWVKPRNFHITVYFFGAVPTERLDNLQVMLAVGLRRFQAFELSFDRYVLAPKPSEARMIWARYRKAGVFRALVQFIHSLYTQIEPSVQARKSPIPHLTLARIKQKEKTPQGPWWDGPTPPPKLSVNELVLWESTLFPEGPEYSVLRRYKL
ncbi:MAG: RNA 2',3'-cyclic phosphodiesterase [Bacteroidota bacterium]